MWKRLNEEKLNHQAMVAKSLNIKTLTEPVELVQLLLFWLEHISQGKIPFLQKADNEQKRLYEFWTC